MTYVALPAFRVLTAARKSYDTFDPNKHGLEGEYGNWGKTPGTQLQQNKGQSGSVTLPP